MRSTRTSRSINSRIEQLAGDLLPNASKETSVGSRFNRLLLTTEEGGAQAKDYEARMLGDRVRAVGTVWLGQTIGCCQCHDHKFDPITARDFYSMGAFFADIKEPIIGKREPGMLVTNSTQAAELKRLQAAVDATQTNLDLLIDRNGGGVQNLGAGGNRRSRQADPLVVLQPTTATGEQGTKLTIEKTGVVVAETRGAKPADTYVVKVTTKLKGITGFRLEALSQVSLPGQGPGRSADGTFVISGISATDAKDQPLKIAAAVATSQTDQYPAAAGLIRSRTRPAVGVQAQHSAAKMPSTRSSPSRSEMAPSKRSPSSCSSCAATTRRSVVSVSSATTAEKVETPALVLPPEDVRRSSRSIRPSEPRAQQSSRSNFATPAARHCHCASTRRDQASLCQV